LRNHFKKKTFVDYSLKPATMFISVNHKINNPGEFWTSAQKSLPELPTKDVQRICNVFPNTDLTEATCIWEASSIADLDHYLRSKVGSWSTETYFEINAAQAMGLPK
jgi:hypothetical protein